MAVLEHEVEVPLITKDDERRKEMREGVLIPDRDDDRMDIRFSCEEYYGGLHCGATMDVWLDDHWQPARIEKDSNGWFLDGIKSRSILGLKVRI